MEVKNDTQIEIEVTDITPDDFNMGFAQMWGTNEPHNVMAADVENVDVAMPLKNSCGRTEDSCWFKGNLSDMVKRTKGACFSCTNEDPGRFSVLLVLRLRHLGMCFCLILT